MAGGGGLREKLGWGDVGGDVAEAADDGPAEGLARAVGCRRPRSRRGRQRDPGPLRAGRHDRRARVRADRRGPRRAGRPDTTGRSCGRTCRRATARRRAGRRGRDDALGHLQAFDLRPIGELRTRIVHESDWADAWKAHFPVLRVGRRIVIRPTWRRHRRAPGDVVLALDPGMAFGTGLHPTTRLCLAAVERCGPTARSTGARVLDVGCGSGILAIAAARLGAVRGLGLDTDPIAIDATTANARRNGLVRRIRAREGRLPSGRGPFDVVLANLIAGVLIPLAPASRDEVAAGRDAASRRASSSTARREVRAAFEAAGLTVVRSKPEGDWVALEAVARDDRVVARRSATCVGQRQSGPARTIAADAATPRPARRPHRPRAEPVPALDPAAIRAADAAARRPSRPVRSCAACSGSDARDRSSSASAWRSPVSA